ncbi:SseB family protein [Glycomyces xiaoerkulensis]|uniref:SseB family protein n=1 Tax=Glycomyces xiaoerkulensis TaxID=2038139 RepID=UPI0018E40B70|nr:SseB family protein [Glycomyces xiaoerkulensis]
MWEPSNEIEHRLREALRADDQDGYFRILSQIELVLPLSYEDPAGIGGADTWATWTTDDRTHILAFTSEAALSLCLRDNAGSSRRVRFNALSDAWPDEDWWLAVNPGLPIEGYLPAWFVTEVAQGMTTVPAESQSGEQQAFASVNQSDPFANPMEPAPGRRDSDFMPAAPSVPDVPAPPRRSDGQGATGAYSTVDGTTGAGLPRRQPPQAEPPGSQSDPFAEPAGGQSSPFPEQPQWPTEQTDWPDAPEWLREQQPDPSTLAERQAAESARSDPYARQSPPPQQADSGAGGSFTSMSSAFERRPAAASEPAPSSERRPAPAELSGEEAEPILAESAAKGDTAAFLQTLLSTSVILPVADPEATAIRVGDPAFRWASDIVDGIHGITVYTTVERLQARSGEDAPYTQVPFGWLIQHWPGVEYALYVNPGTEVGANMSGPEVEPLLKWAEAKELLALATEMERRQAAEVRAKAAARRSKPVQWQKTIPHHQVSFYLERGYDRVGGFVHPVESVQHLRTPAQLYLALGLIRSSEDFNPTDDSVHVLRWTGYRTDLYPRAVGGNDEPTAAERGGWIVEPGPFRGDGFAASETADDRIPEFKIDSLRLPHGAGILRIDSRGEVTDVAVYDADTREWAPVDGAPGGPAAIEAGPSPTPPVGQPAGHGGGFTSGPMGEAAPGPESQGYQGQAHAQAQGYDTGGYESSALGDAFGDPAQGHYDLLRPAPEEKAASVLENRDREWKGA